ncbi:type II secretion system protein GspC [Pseudomonadota bacterium]
MSAVNWKKVLETVANPGARLQNSMQIAMVLVVAYSAAQLTWRMAPPAEEGAAPVVLFESVDAPVSPRGSGSENQIPQWHLFGDVKKVQTAAPAPVIDLPETNLKLTLRGVIASKVQSEARAIVADSSGKENFYKIGDKLPGNAVLKEVHGDRIVIQRGARYETLKLPKKQLGLMTETKSSSRSLSRGPGRGSNEFLNSRSVESLSQVRDVLMNDPQRLGDLIRISPKRNGSGFSGYELQPGRDARFLSRYGLMPGDVVKSINGVQLDNPTKGLGLMKDLATMESLDIEVERNGTRQRFTLPMQ